jgi:hypothetical protein
MGFAHRYDRRLANGVIGFVANINENGFSSAGRDMAHQFCTPDAFD